MRSGRWPGTSLSSRGMTAVAAGAAVVAAARRACAAPLDFADAGLDERTLLLLGVLIGVIVFAVVVAVSAIGAVRHTRRQAAKANAAAAQLENQLDVVHAILVAEPQILVHWDGDGEPVVVTATLPPNLGVPRDVSELLRFAGWLDRDSARELQQHVEALHGAGLAFNVMLRTTAGSHVEADGRAAGGGTILKIRDLAGRREELAQVLDQHKRLGHDIRAARTLLDALPSPVWFRAPDGSLEWVNRAYVQAVEGGTADAVRAQQIELLEARDRTAVERQLAAVDTFRRRVHTIVAGERHAYDVIVLPIGRSSAGVAIDAAALETAESELNRHIEAHVRTLDRIPTAVAVFSPDQHLAYHNQAFLDLWPLDADWLATRPREGEILDRLREQRRLPEQADYRSWKARRLGAYSGHMPHEDWWHLPDGRTIHVVADQGPDAGVTYLYEDMTARLQLESRYNALIHVQKETLDHLREGVAVFASDGRLKLFNPAFANIWKLNHAVLEKEPHIDEVITLCRVLLDKDEAWDEVKSAVTGIDDQRQSIHGQLNRPDGSVLLFAGLPLPDGATLLTYVDITDSKRVERALIERNEALEAADRLKSAFISHVSYELRTPLTNIIGFAELLAAPMTGALTIKQREYVDDIRASGDALLAIVNDILDLATIDAGEFELKLAPVQVRDVIKAAVQGVRDRLQAANLRLEIGVAQDARDFVADAKRVTQVLFNLLSNAIGFSDPGAVIKLVCRREGDMLAFSVQDQGPGIPAEFQRSVFERFESRSGGSLHRGAGLGLAIVKSLVELHGGSVSLLSAEGIGTKVTVRFPTSHRQKSGEEEGAQARPTRYHPAA